MLPETNTEHFSYKSGPGVKIETRTGVDWESHRYNEEKESRKYVQITLESKNFFFLRKTLTNNITLI